MTSRHIATPLLALACLAGLAPAYAQDDPATRQPGRTPTTQTPNENDRFLATWIATANNNEIQLAQTAQQQAQNPEVKQFAQMMVKDHGEFGRKLQRFTGTAMPGETNGGRTGERPGERIGERTGDRPGERTGERPGERPGERTGERPGERPGERTGQPPGTGQPVDASGRRAGELNHASLIQELGRKYLESARKALEGKSGAEYDRCYMQMQVMAHTHVLDKLQVFSSHASPELRTVLDEGQQTVRSHLEKAKDIAKRLEGGAGTGTGSHEHKK